MECFKHFDARTIKNLFFLNLDKHLELNYATVTGRVVAPMGRYRVTTKEATKLRSGCQTKSIQPWQFLDPSAQRNKFYLDAVNNRYTK
jgi:hypothetical protein